MIQRLQELCKLDGTSGDETAVRDFILSKIDGFCTWQLDAMGNIIAFKKGKKESAKRLMIDAHMDEIGLIITRVLPNGFLKFTTVGGIETAVLMNRRVRINENVYGVIGNKPVHLTKGDEGKKLPAADTLSIDIGAKTREEAMESVGPGDRAVLVSEFVQNGTLIRSKALDDRIGCAVLIQLLQEESPYDFYATFTVQEEVGARGAKTAAFTVNPDAALILEATTAADLGDVPEEKQVCELGKGVAVSFMDRGTVYDRNFYNAALASGIPVQPKRAVAGGNNSGTVHLNRSGVRTLALSVPCRYIHSACCVADVRDMDAALQLARRMRDDICGGTVE